MDGVIVDNFKYHLKAWRVFYDKHKIAISDEDILKTFGSTNEDILPGLFGGKLSKQELAELAGDKEAIYREIYAPDIKPVKGLPTFLTDLKAAGVKMAVATSAPPENLNFVLDRLKLADYFDHTVDASQISRGKPDPEIYTKAGQLLALPPERCIVFEDSLPGIASARAAGMSVVGVATTNPPEVLKDYVLLIHDFSQINASQFLTLIP